MDDHPLLAAMPRMSAETQARVKANVERHGLRARIPVWQGQKLDGRGLEQICDELGIPENERYAPAWPNGAAVTEEMVADFVMGSKLDRAHWTKGQVNVALYERWLWDEELRQRAQARQKAGVRLTRDEGSEWGRAVDVLVKKYGGPDGGSAASLYRVRAIHRHDPALYEEVKAGVRGVEPAYLELVRRHVIPPARQKRHGKAKPWMPGGYVRLPRPGDDPDAYMLGINADLAYHVDHTDIDPARMAQAALALLPEQRAGEDLRTLADAYTVAAEIYESDLGLVRAPVVVEVGEPQLGSALPSPRRQLDVEWVHQQQAYQNGETEDVGEMVARLNALGADKSAIILAVEQVRALIDAVLAGARGP